MKAWRKSFRWPAMYSGASGDQYSVQARLLPFLEQGNLYSQIDLDEEPSNQLEVIKQRIATYICPDEVNDHERTTSSKTTYPMTYGANFGTWFIWSPVSNYYSDGAISVNHFNRAADFADGLSNTLAFAEVKAFQPYVRDTPNPTTENAPPPADAAAVLALAATGTFKGETAHTEWTDSPSFQSSFTTTLTPNTKVPYTNGGTEYDIDLVTKAEGKSATQPSYAAMTSRSYHAGKLVQVVMVGGSVHTISASIDQNTWRALGTRDGREVISDF